MIIFWNRREVYVGYSMKDFNMVSDILSAKRIKYDYRLVNNIGSSGKVGQRSEYDTMYYVYVHKRDYENAKFILTK